ncbi:DUF4270 family protein [Flagellimonas olearia]|uniref:Membrane protein n=1 Tax=Flagellimonas olearia TaxID=552546 RepID=A0A444VID6_9FLAO|nr:DUF4270 family protein [Allomuricauda olearia]RYC50529.1 membrane protein [Allomuricauda olearia]
MRRLLGMITPSILLLASCTSENYNSSDFLAGEAFSDSNMRVVLIDTMTIETSTMKFDSIQTSQSSRILVGQYSDPIFGKVKASSYMGLIPNSFSIDSEAEYDSIVLFLKLDNYYYNDTLETSTLHIKRLTKTLRPNEGDALYNTAEASYLDEDLGALSYQPRPMESDTIAIKISDELGRELFNGLQEKLITNTDQFKDYFKGIGILPGDNDNGSVVGFSKDTGASFMRLYYGISEEDERVQDNIDFELDLSTTPVPFFNQILAENPIEQLQMLQDKESVLSSSEAANRCFVQSGVGVAARIQFPTVKTIYDIRGQGTILDAVLKIKPEPGSFDDNLILRDTLSVYVVDRNNDLIQQLFYQEVSPVQAILNREKEEFNEIYYEIQLGSYIEQLLLAERETNEALILLPNNYDSTVDRFVLNGMDNSDFRTLLELTYAIYDEDEE